MPTVPLSLSNTCACSFNHARPSIMLACPNVSWFSATFWAYVACADLLVPSLRFLSVSACGPARQAAFTAAELLVNLPFEPVLVHAISDSKTSEQGGSLQQDDSPYGSEVQQVSGARSSVCAFNFTVSPNFVRHRASQITQWDPHPKVKIVGSDCKVCVMGDFCSNRCSSEGRSR